TSLPRPIFPAASSPPAPEPGVAFPPWSGPGKNRSRADSFRTSPGGGGCPPGRVWQIPPGDRSAGRRRVRAAVRSPRGRRRRRCDRFPHTGPPPPAGPNPARSTDRPSTASSPSRSPLFFPLRSHFSAQTDSIGKGQPGQRRRTAPTKKPVRPPAAQAVHPSPSRGRADPRLLFFTDGLRRAQERSEDDPFRLHPQRLRQCLLKRRIPAAQNQRQRTSPSLRQWSGLHSDGSQSFQPFLHLMGDVGIEPFLRLDEGEARSPLFPDRENQRPPLRDRTRK